MSLTFHVIVAALAASAAEAFVSILPSAVVAAPPSSCCVLSSLHHETRSVGNSDDIEKVSYNQGLCNVATSTVLTFGLLLLLPSNDAFAVAPQQDFITFHSQLFPTEKTTAPTATTAAAASLYSSTVQISSTIQTMDFSLPSSYDNLSDPVVSGVAELTKTEVIITGGSRKEKPTGSSTIAAKDGAFAVARAEKVAQRKALELSTGSAKEESAAALAERVAQRKAYELEQAQLDEQRKDAIDVNIKRLREEKAAKRAALAQAEKEAARVAGKTEEDTFKGMKFLDTSMPTY